ncbi:AIPR family protein [Micromonospora sp. WMMD712]|uniref:AIPR family protein n=1 Tax=Micromonospora sp. WMMD712 TaxID=3016096 RepID=UPI00249B5C54|nr:AIPR family protein [Micromonospora sp. WMMD712]WFE60232.1 AIPR family protein [Micromonospora sp. WMMD712]
MSGSTEPKTQVRQVQDALLREFEGLIDLTDLANRPPAEREQSLRSRALAALVVRDLTGCDSAAAADAVVDGQNDIGIDAVATDKTGSHLWLVQAKWSDKGKARFEVADALKFVDGLRHIDGRKFDRFNMRFQDLADRVDAVLSTPGSKITLVTAVMRTDALAADVMQRLVDAQDEFNQYGNILDQRVYLARDIWEVVRNDFAEPPIALRVGMQDWIKISGQYEAFQGIVSVADIAQWYDDHEDRLFDRNIRKPLGITQVNQGLIATLTDEPHNFWFFNNGITLLCDSLEPEYARLGARSPVVLRLTGASIVNGAQTVHAIHHAFRKNAEAVAEGYVTVRVISLRTCPPGFADAVTTATNTQNRVERRDFVALDPVQRAIREDFLLSLQKTYAVKRGEPPAPDSGCSVEVAATALACAHRNSDLAVRAKRNVDLLWEEGPQGAYQLLFDAQDRPSAHQIWRSVLILREVDNTIDRTAKKRQERAEAIVERGNRLIAHIVFQHLDLDGIDDPDADWEQVLAQVPEAVERVAAWLVYHVDATFGRSSIVSSTLANPDHCRTLAGLVLADLKRGAPVPDLPIEYQPASIPKQKRRPNAVPTLIDAGVLADGTPLTYQAAGRPEREAMAAWIAADPSRAAATWVNQRVRPILWAADGKRYSPSGLVQEMWRLAGWGKAPAAAQGPARWHLPGGKSLWALAQETLAAVGDDVEEDA